MPEIRGVNLGRRWSIDYLHKRMPSPELCHNFWLKSATAFAKAGVDVLSLVSDCSLYYSLLLTRVS